MHRQIYLEYKKDPSYKAFLKNINQKSEITLHKNDFSDLKNFTQNFQTPRIF